MIPYQNSYILGKIIIPETYNIFSKFILLENIKKTN